MLLPVLHNHRSMAASPFSSHNCLRQSSHHNVRVSADRLRSYILVCIAYQPGAFSHLQKKGQFRGTGVFKPFSIPVSQMKDGKNLSCWFQITQFARNPVFYSYPLLWPCLTAVYAGGSEPLSLLFSFSCLSFLRHLSFEAEFSCADLVPKCKFKMRNMS